MRTMLATPTRVVPPGDGWAHEVKWDGMRILADRSPTGLRLRARSGADATARFPELGGLASAGPDLLLDGEVIALQGGVPSFAALSERIHVADPRAAQVLSEARPVTYMVFDLLRVGGQVLIDQPWSVRRSLLERLDLESFGGGGVAWKVPGTYDDGELLLDVTRRQGLEGVVSKRRSSTYQPGTRSADWLKLPHRATVSVVVGGWRPETSGRDRVGALLVGTPTADGSGRLELDGRVGAGLAGRAGDALRPLLDERACETSPFATEVPREDATGARWVRPTLVVDVQSLGRSGGGRLRQPAYVGVRTDLTPADLAAQEVTDG
ncbi:ATP-dependent DNA ligase [Arsenicicoccus sp. oral taxon 190]|uniref:ATP-dependent DNA ligase n=1 Tax=Arsenicicoccus sp. oral taxon 190 TaxID=1658671 RepID=UPI00067A3DA0|nr:DNA ligase [Arsenicicoccus sp. oral taxon 190]AKT50519.1 DNA ligase [Arsenicicoccus sp. oral taxon 190]